MVARDAPEGRTTYQYDPVGRLLRATSPSADLLLTRDPLGRVTAETVDGRTASTVFDAAGRVASRRTPSGLISAWNHDARGKATSLTTAGHTIGFTHDPLGNLVDQSLVTPTSWQVLRHSHDPVGRMLSQTLYVGLAGQSSSRVVTHRGYAYRPDGYLTATVDETGDHRTLTLDSVGRITTVTAQGWLERYAYSPTGDIVHAQWPDDGDHPARGEREYTGTLIRRAGRVRYEHDAQGRVILRQRAHHSGKPDTWRYAWDSQDRLTAVQTPDGKTWSYRYDPLGRRIGKYRHSPDGGIAERVDFSWDGPRLIENLHWSPDGTIKATTWDYQPGSFTPTTQTDRSWLATAPQTEIDRRFHTIITDLVGTPTHLVTPDGDITWYTQITIWGTTIAASNGGIDCPLRFPGQYFDPETGHHYNNQRHYDPDTGRYLCKDPLGLAAGSNQYAYAPNPTLWIDALGLASGTCSGGGFTGPQDHVALGRDPRGNDLNVRDFADQVGARHLMSSPDWRNDVQSAIARVGRGEGRISFMIDGLPGANRGIAVTLQRAQEALAADNNTLLATQWELLQVHAAGLMDRVDFFKFNRRLNSWGQL